MRTIQLPLKWPVAKWCLGGVVDEWGPHSAGARHIVCQNQSNVCFFCLVSIYSLTGPQILIPFKYEDNQVKYRDWDYKDKMVLLHVCNEYEHQCTNHVYINLSFTWLFILPTSYFVNMEYKFYEITIIFSHFKGSPKMVCYVKMEINHFNHLKSVYEDHIIRSLLSLLKRVNRRHNNGECSSIGSSLWLADCFTKYLLNHYT